MGCQECKNWEEHFYWNHLDSAKFCFFKVLIADFSKTLAIPRKFALNLKDLKGLQAEQVKLKGPSSNTWSVKLRTLQGDVFFAEGWKEFAKDHELEEGDFLVFRYAGDSCFRVQAFDMSGCEKERTYFAGGNARAAAAAAAGGNGSGRRRTRAKSGEAHEDGGRCSFTASQTKAAATATNVSLVGRNGRKAAATAASQHQNGDFITCSSDSEEVEEEEEEGKDEALGKPSQTCKDYGQQPRMLSRVTKNNSKSCSSSSVIRSARTPNAATEEQKKALSAAKSVKPAGPAFITTLTQSSVSRNFILVIPAQFAEESLPVEDQGVLLRLAGDDMTWRVKYLTRHRITRFGSGWRMFVLDNELREDDVCRFDLISSSTTATGSSNMVFEVRIFRAAAAPTKRKYKRKDPPPPQPPPPATVRRTRRR